MSLHLVRSTATSIVRKNLSISKIKKMDTRKLFKDEKINILGEADIETCEPRLNVTSVISNT